MEGLVCTPADPIAAYVFAHGAGAGMTHRFMESVSERLAERSIATLRFNFPYMSAGRRFPDRPPVLKLALASVIGFAVREFEGIPILGGGKSMGGRILADALAEGSVSPLNGLIFFGYPLHPPGKETTSRADLLDQVECPMLFLQGTRDKLARIDLLETVVSRLPTATLHRIAEADHSFRVPKRTGLSESDVLNQLADTVLEWLPHGRSR
ncbi:MAG: alpha/beta hydrolase [Rhodothermales bacterium]|nr:alpha/beta hydrolase [Rhodothermales bacterium]